MIALGLLAAARRRSARARRRASWEATEEVRPTPRELLDGRGLRRWRWVADRRRRGSLVLDVPVHDDVRRRQPRLARGDLRDRVPLARRPDRVGRTGEPRSVRAGRRRRARAAGALTSRARTLVLARLPDRRDRDGRGRRIGHRAAGACGSAACSSASSRSRSRPRVVPRAVQRALLRVAPAGEHPAADAAAHRLRGRAEHVLPLPGLPRRGDRARRRRCAGAGPAA